MWVLSSGALNWTVVVFLMAGVMVILVRNSSWRLEMRSLKEWRFLEIDGFIAPVLLFATIPSAHFIGAFAERFELCNRAYGELLGGVVAFTFSIGFALSGLRQNNGIGKICAALTLLLLLAVFLFSTVPGFR